MTELTKNDLVSIYEKLTVFYMEDDSTRDKLYEFAIRRIAELEAENETLREIPTDDQCRQILELTAHDMSVGGSVQYDEWEGMDTGCGSTGELFAAIRRILIPEAEGD